MEQEVSREARLRTEVEELRKQVAILFLVVFDYQKIVMLQAQKLASLQEKIDF